MLHISKVQQIKNPKLDNGFMIWNTDIKQSYSKS